jgi:hypothetical protein
MMRPHRIRAADAIPAARAAATTLSDEQQAQRAACAASFRAFLPFWQFLNRDTGVWQTFTALWPGQAALVEQIALHRYLFALKAGKLGFTELACAYDGWLLCFGPPNSRVHIFSKDAVAAQDLLARVRDGVERLPPWLRRGSIGVEPGGDTRTTLKLRVGPDDVRTCVSYAAAQRASIDQTATHVHLDELAHMPFPADTWHAVQSTIAPAPIGSVHIVTRGAGDDNFAADLWRAAQRPGALITPFFQPWSARPDRDVAWREQQRATMTDAQFRWYLPETPEDALAGDQVTTYIPPEVWDLCYDPDLPPLEFGDPIAVVLGVDLAVTADCAAVVAVSFHPDRPGVAAIRRCAVWDPKDYGGHVPLEEFENFLRLLCDDKCRNWHPRSRPDPECELCQAELFKVPALNVVQVAYDPYQMEYMADILKRANIVWLRPFLQQGDREVADSRLHKMALNRQIAHNGDARLAAHIANCGVRVQPDQDSKMRIVKKAADRKVDLAVAASMAIDRLMGFNL